MKIFRLKAKTIPVTLGEKGARMLIMGSLCATVVMSIIILALKPQLFNVLSLAGAAGAGLYLLLLPAYKLYRSQNNSYAAVLFNRASYYPLAMLVIIAIDISCCVMWTQRSRYGTTEFIGT